MHRKYAGQGLVAISVHLDPPLDAEVKDQVLTYLRARQATFTNLILDEASELWQDKLHSAFLPNVFVFNREGQWTQFTTEDVKYDEIEKLVVRLLKK